MIEFTIYGEVPSKKNAWRHGKDGVYLPKTQQKALDDLQLQMQVHKPRKPLEGSLAVMIEIGGHTNKDLDNQVTTLLDLLQKAGIIKNDKDVEDIHAWYGGRGVTVTVEDL